MFRICYNPASCGWLVSIRQHLRLHQLAEQGLGLLQDRDPELRRRLQEAHDMFSLIEEELPSLLQRVESEQRG
jgi:hypothetical protein